MIEGVMTREVASLLAFCSLFRFPHHKGVLISPPGPYSRNVQFRSDTRIEPSL